ncbi:MAG TPA: hypothetical protein VFU88_09725 [Ktedonobacterales bacterium]|nr:hypothetical protein [Ktedonobacterales bacterium]
MIVALAGRRVDAADAPESRFPAANEALVRERIRQVFMDFDVSAVVCSAAAGADLVALEVAASLGLRRRVVLPFARDRFRVHSVADRPGEWGPRFQRVCSELRGVSGMRVLHQSGTLHESARHASRVILDEAGELAKAEVRSGLRRGSEGVTAVVVWDGASRGPDDLTADFAEEARRRGLRVVEISTR